MNFVFALTIAKLGSWLGKVADDLRALLMFIAEVRSELYRRRVVRHVETLSDHTLKDIGITRSMIQHAVKYGRP